MKKLILLAPLVLAGCVTTLPMTDNVKMTDNKSFIETVTFDWVTNKNIDRTTSCIRREMPVLSDVQTQDVIRYTDTKNSEIGGDGSFAVSKYGFTGITMSNIKFQYEISIDKNNTKLTFKEIYSSYPSNKYTKLQPYAELLADVVYEKLEVTAKDLENCK